MTHKTSPKIQNHEFKHSINLIRIYEIYSLLSDFYTYYSNKKYSDKTIGIYLSKKFKGVVYTKNKKFIKNALVNVKSLYKLKVFEKTNDIKFNKLIINTIKDHIQYFERILVLFDDVVCRKDITKLKQEINIFKNERIIK